MSLLTEILRDPGRIRQLLGDAPLTTPPPPSGPPPDLLRESERRAQAAQRGRGPAYDHGITDHWPDPYGPDPVVFGSWPRVKETPDEGDRTT